MSDFGQAGALPCLTNDGTGHPGSNNFSDGAQTILFPSAPSTRNVGERGMFGAEGLACFSGTVLLSQHAALNTRSPAFPSPRPVRRTFCLLCLLRELRV